LVPVLDSLLAVEHATVTDVARILSAEDDWWVARQDKSEDDYWRYMEGDPDTTGSMILRRLRNLLGGRALGAWHATFTEEVCRVDAPGPPIGLTLTMRPRCLITEIYHRGDTVLR
jgi:hypothetical protein